MFVLHDSISTYMHIAKVRKKKESNRKGVVFSKDSFSGYSRQRKNQKGLAFVIKDETFLYCIILDRTLSLPYLHNPVFPM